METAREKAESFCSMREFANLPNKEGFVSSLTILLKEQDRDTRHACAEAVSLLRGQMGEGGDPFTAAHAACMNVKAV